MRIVIKLGGATLEDAALLQRAVLAVKQLAAEHQVAVIHGGGGELTRKLTVTAHAFSESARKKIEAKGGSCEVVATPKPVAK